VEIYVGAWLGMMGFATLLYSQTPQVLAVRAGHLFDSKSGQNANESSSAD